MTTNYIITKTDGTYFATVPEGSLLQQAGLELIGKNYVGFGQALNNDLVGLAENFAATTPPTGTLTGQLWYDKANNTLKYYSGTTFKNVVSGFFQGAKPTTAQENEIWFDTSAQQLYVYSNGTFNLVGPNVSGNKGGVITDTIVDTSNVGHSVLKMQINGYNLAILTEDYFLPKDNIQGFLPSTTLYPGINIGNAVNYNSNNNQYPAKFVGTSTLADALNENAVSEGQTGLLARYILRNNQDGVIDPGSLTASNGFYVINNSLIQMIPDPLGSNDFEITHKGKSNKIFLSATSAGGVTKKIVTVNGSSGNLGVNTLSPTTQLHVVGDSTLEGNVSLGSATSTSVTWNGATLANTDSSNKLATTSFVKAQFTNTALLGSPTATTPPSADASTRLATTAWVAAQGYTNNSGISGIGVDQSGINIAASATRLNFTSPMVVTPSATGGNSVDITVSVPQAAGGIPSGLISMWYGLATSCPVGWAVCDGTHGTPDLRDRFIVGAGGAYNFKDVGGSISATTSQAGGQLSGTSDSTALTIDQIPSHKHVDPYAEGSGFIGGPGYTFDPVPGTEGAYGSAKTDKDQSLYYTSAVGGGKAHNHTFSFDWAHNHTVNTVPPYYALYYIMKL